MSTSRIIESEGIVVEPNLGPLTTIWTQPTACYQWSTIYNNYIGPGMRSNSVQPSCYPPAYVADTAYSPGVCPSGWAYRGEPTSGDSWTTSYPERLSVRQCCPGTLSPYSLEQWEWCIGKLPPRTFYTLWSTGPDVSSGSWVTTSWTSTRTAWARPIIVAYQSTDTEIFTLLPPAERPSIASSTASPGATITGSAADATSTAPGETGSGSGSGSIIPSSTRASSSSSSTSTASSSSSGLSTGAKAGIGVGVPVGVILLLSIAGLWIFLIRRKRNKNQMAMTPTAPPTQPASYFEPPKQNVYAQHATSPNYDYQHVPEMASPDSAPGYSTPYGGPVEAEGSGVGVVHELPGSPHQRV